jgi:hypothetical protein
VRLPEHDDWILAGVVGVDSGQLMITDPCYLESEWDPIVTLDFGSKAAGVYSYDGACHATLSEEKFGQLNYRLGHAGAGVAFSSGYGDGCYEVYVRKEEGRIAEARVIMIEEEKDEDAG